MSINYPMEYIKRLSNVIAWATFPITCFFILILFSKGVTYFASNSPELCNEANSCTVLHSEDIRNSENLRKLNALSGDWVIEDKLWRKYPKWIRKSPIYDFSEIEVSELLPIVFIFIFQYLLVGKFRFIPWLKI
jgi:hypothetical protein